MTKLFRVTLVLAGALIALAGTVAAQEQATGAGIEKVVAEYLRQVNDGAVDQGPQGKAVSRTDKAEATIVGTVAFVDATDFLSDGTPFRIVAVRSRKPISQNVFVVCLGSAFNTSCGRLGVGRRASFTADVLVITDGDSAGLALLVAKRLQT